MAKKTIHELYIDHLRYPSKGIAFLAGENGTAEVAVNNTLPGQTVTAECVRKKKKIIGRAVAVTKPAPQEIPAICPSFGVCGGCTFLNIPYEYELELKKQAVLRLLKDYAPPQVDIVPSPTAAGYRNKMEFSFGDTENAENAALSLGIRNRNRYYEVTQPQQCVLVNQDFMDIVAATLRFFSQTAETFYHRVRHTGSLRYLVLRRGEFTNEILVNLVTTSQLGEKGESEKGEKWDKKAILQGWTAEMLGLPLQSGAKIVGILHTTSDAVSDAVVPEDTAVLHGQNYFTEKICGLSFDISPYAFFQTNSGGAELLYNTVMEFAGLGSLANSANSAKTARTIYDLYCGTGTITQCLAKQAKQAKQADYTVIGVDIVAEAIAMASQNAEKNGLPNCKFIAADVLKFLEQGAENTENTGRAEKVDFSADILVLDPPRDGIHPKALPRLVALGVPKIIYISCKPTSLVRDLPHFTAAGYEVLGVRLHDMFPRTPHIEVVCWLGKG